MIALISLMLVLGYQVLDSLILILIDDIDRLIVRMLIVIAGRVDQIADE